MGNFHVGVIMHSGQRLCSGHLSDEASCKVLTSSFGHLFPRSSSLFRLQWPFLSPYRPGPPSDRLGRGRGNKRCLGRDLGRTGRMRCRRRGPPSACPAGPALSGHGSPSSPGRGGRPRHVQGPGSQSIQRTAAPAERRARRDRTPVLKSWPPPPRDLP